MENEGSSSRALQNRAIAASTSSFFVGVMKSRPAALEALPSIEGGGRLASGRHGAGTDSQRGLESGGDGIHDLVLHGEDVFEVAIVPLGPELAAVGRVDELAADADALARATHAPGNDVANPEIAAHLPRVDGSTFVGEYGAPSDDREQAPTRQAHGEIFRDAIGEVVLLRGIVAERSEREDGDGRPTGEAGDGERGRALVRLVAGRRIGLHSIDAQRARQVLDRAIAHVFELEVELALDLLERRGG